MIRTQRWSGVFAVLCGLSAFVPAYAQTPPVWNVLQDSELSLSVAQLTVGHPAASTTLTADHITIEDPPVRGQFERIGSSFRYRPESRFFGRDTVTYSWVEGWGRRVRVEAEILVTPWIVPLIGPQTSTGLPGADDVGYYNSHSGTFYLCAEQIDGSQSCVSHRYPQFEPGWLPLFGTWRSSSGAIYPDRPALFDPMQQTLMFLDYSTAEHCPTCDDEIPAETLQLIEEVPAGTAMSVPVAADLSGDGVDSVVFFHLGGRHYAPQVEIFQILFPSLSDDRLWPLAVPQSDGRDALAVYGPDSGWLEVLHGPQAGASELWFGVSSIATARFVFAEAVLIEAYDLYSHSLSINKPDPDTCGNGGQLVRFPVDPDPPPTDPGDGRTPTDPCPTPFQTGPPGI